MSVTALSTSQSLPTLPSGTQRTDHLGISIRTSSNRYKYARTFTMSFDHKETAAAKLDELHYALTRDARKVADLNIPTLGQMFVLFSDCLDTGETLVGPKTFKAVLSRCAINDDVLVRRMFTGFAEEGKLDYRDFMRALVCGSGAPIDEKLALLFRVYDVDRSESLSLYASAPLHPPTSHTRVPSMPPSLSAALHPPTSHARPIPVTLLDCTP